MKIEIWTDGACSGNPGPGGYAYVVKNNDEVLIKGCGHEDETTNNAMELKAIVQAIKYVFNYEPARVKEITLYSDSAYCLNAINQKWIYNWFLNGWKTKEGKEIKNLELWQKLYPMLFMKNTNISFVKIKGHAGNKYNELVDKIAKKAIKIPLEGLSFPSKEK